jgi:hypothetical protein
MSSGVEAGYEFCLSFQYREEVVRTAGAGWRYSKASDLPCFACTVAQEACRVWKRY